MTQTHSKPRQQAEIAFAKAQSQFLARERPAEELDAARARNEKTLRLREARLARDLEERARSISALASDRSAKA